MAPLRAAPGRLIKPGHLDHMGAMGIYQLFAIDGLTIGAMMT